MDARETAKESSKHGLTKTRSRVTSKNATVDANVWKKNALSKSMRASLRKEEVEMAKHSGGEKKKAETQINSNVRCCIIPDLIVGFTGTTERQEKGR